MESYWQDFQWENCNLIQQTNICNYLVEHLIRVNVEVTRAVCELTQLRKEFSEIQEKNYELKVELEGMQNAKVQNKMIGPDKSIESHEQSVCATGEISKADYTDVIVQTVKKVYLVEREEETTDRLQRNSLVRCDAKRDEGDWRRFVKKQNRLRKRTILNSRQWAFRIRTLCYGYVIILPRQATFGDGRNTKQGGIREATKMKPWMKRIVHHRPIVGYSK